MSDAAPPRHPAARHWTFPPQDRAALPAPLQRVNVRELCARPGRFEHHLLVVARVGEAQLEVVTASEPLYFAHHNISDEWALSLTTGDPLLDGFPLLTHLCDYESGRDVARLRHHVGDLVLHPFGHLHWPGRLRPPHDAPAFPDGERRAILAAVYCAATPLGAGVRDVAIDPERSDDVRLAEAGVPLALYDTRAAPPQALAALGGSAFSSWSGPGAIAPARGAYVLVVDGDGPDAHTGDLVYVPAGVAFVVDHAARALVMSGVDHDAPPPPESWQVVPRGPFACFEDGPRGSLPVTQGGLSLAAVSDALVRVEVEGRGGDVPRYWLARFLFRVALHGYAIGYLETYGGFFYDDREGVTRIGLRDRGFVTVPRGEVPALVERLYRAVAPPGYVERLV